ncbi:hypothetical protein D3H65_28015 [Paraflavitalea soli]|uniref:Uncharacterized protein n=1 Tax=Paraflavitalea soli TaxID=2315862 RepID=A0A3B7MVY9_9BACT|nr:tetratricopeptide repeat protein [Paraflavitalea soli]AXY77593.1 hypothetical protein D3H65_28015 [Paraflavitalea soli]
MARKSLLLWLFVCSLSVAHAQPAISSSLSKDEQVKTIWAWYKKSLLTQDSASVVNQLQAAEQYYRNKDLELPMQQAWLIQQVYLSTQYRGLPTSVDIMLRAEETARQKGWPMVAAECWYYTGDYYFVLEKFGPAFEYMQKARHLFEAKGINNYPYTRRYAGGLAECYYRFGEYEQAIKHYKEALAVPAYWNNVFYFTAVENSIALCYQQLKQYDSAIYYFNRSHASAAAVKDSFYMSLSYGNLGYTYHLQGKDMLALPLLLEDYEGSMKAREWGSAINAAMVLVTIYLRQGKVSEAQRYLDLARPYVYQWGGAVLYKNWYENLYRYHQYKGNDALALQYADSLLLYKDSLAVIRGNRTLNQAKLKVETEQHLKAINELEYQRRQEVFIRNSLLIVLLLTCIIGLLWVNRQRLKRNKELQLSAMAREKDRQQLAFAQQELTGYTNKLKEKNELIEQFRQELEQLQQHGLQENKERMENLHQLLNATILTEEDWRTFRDLYEKVYPGFFIRLREKMPDLSAADTRLIALTKLQLPPKDMAAMLGVSYDAIKKARQRLRKKVNLPEEGSLDELVNLI